MTDGVGPLRACSVSDLEDGEIFQAEVEGIGTLAIYSAGGAIFATDDLCTHGQASLSEDGFLEEFKVTCAWHEGAFDIRTGEPVKLPCMERLKTYQVTVQDGEVFVAG